MKDTLDTLNHLLMLDHDAVRAYTSAIERIQVPVVKERLSAFRGDHEQHIEDLTALIRTLGGTPKERPDILGPLIQGMTALRAMVGTEQALKAMLQNEQLTNAQYGKALRSGLSPEAVTLVRKNFEDEQRHLAWIKQALDSRLYEAGGPEQHA